MSSGRMSAGKLALVPLALITSGSLANGIDEEALRNGYLRLARTPAAYVMIVEAKRRIQIFDPAAKSAHPDAKYSLVGFEIDCRNASMRYRFAQLLDLPWNPIGPNRKVPGPWHSPPSGSVQEQALVFACKT